MAETLYQSVAPLQNVSALLTLIDRVKHRPFGLPGMAVFYGPSGHGKTTACTYAANEFDGLHLEVQPLWRAKQLLAGIAFELGLKPARTASDIFEQVANELGRRQRPLIIDEADRLIRDDMVEVVRGLYEASNVPVILVGEEELPTKLQRWERVHGRMLDWIATQPATLGDTNQLAVIYAGGLTITEDLKQRLLEESQHSIRRVSINLSYIKEVSLTEGWTTVGVAQWGKRAFFRGDAPPPRRAFAVETARLKHGARMVGRA